ncbi:MAG TPA: hypothetical protein VGH34_19935 [Vicinamibacterales bacterium]|jgi:hypothetical protein
MADAFADLVRRLLSDPDFVIALTARIASRSEPADVIDRLVAYARSRQVSSGQAKVRRVLTDAGVSWEAL